MLEQTWCLSAQKLISAGEFLGTAVGDPGRLEISKEMISLQILKRMCFSVFVYNKFIKCLLTIPGVGGTLSLALRDDEC